MKIFSNVLRKLEHFAGRPWYLPAISLIAAADLFIAIVPTDGLVISSALLKPKRWIATFLWTATGSALGALALSLVAMYWGEPIIHWLAPGALESETWLQTTRFLNHYGAPALFFISVGPAPQQPGVALCALAHMPLFHIFLSVWLGRALKYGFYCWAANYAPKFLKKFKRPEKEAEELLKDHQP